MSVSISPPLLPPRPSLSQEPSRIILLFPTFSSFLTPCPHPPAPPEAPPLSSKAHGRTAKPLWHLGRPLSETPVAGKTRPPAIKSWSQPLGQVAQPAQRQGGQGSGLLVTGHHLQLSLFAGGGVACAVGGAYCAAGLMGRSAAPDTHTPEYASTAYVHMQRPAPSYTYLHCMLLHTNMHAHHLLYVEV